MTTRPTVLIADDHPLVAQGLRALIRPGFDVIEVVNDARELPAAVERGRPDIVLLDLSMPFRNGLDLIPELLTAHPALRIVVVTMHLDRALAELSFERGAHGFVPKEGSAEELNQALDAVLAGQTYRSSRVPKRAYREPTPGDDPEFDRLTPRQREIVALIGEGRTTAEVARQLNLSHRTVEFHRASIRRVLGITSEFGLMEFAITRRLRRAGMEGGDGPGC